MAAPNETANEQQPNKRGFLQAVGDWLSTTGGNLFSGAGLGLAASTLLPGGPIVYAVGFAALSVTSKVMTDIWPGMKGMGGVGNWINNIVVKPLQGKDPVGEKLDEKRGQFTQIAGMVGDMTGVPGVGDMIRSSEQGNFSQNPGMAGIVNNGLQSQNPVGMAGVGAGNFTQGNAMQEQFAGHEKMAQLLSDFSPQERANIEAMRRHVQNGGYRDDLTTNDIAAPRATRQQSSPQRPSKEYSGRT